MRGRPRGFDRTDALKRATSVFWAKGYDGTSLADLTAAMGINAPSLYAAFRSKEALFLEATEYYVNAGGSGIWTALDNDGTAEQAIAGFLTATALAFSEPDTPQGCMVVLGALHQDPSSTVICTDLRRRRAENLAALRRRIERGVIEGDVPPGADVGTLADFYHTVQFGMSIKARDGASRETLLSIAKGALAAWPGLTGTPQTA